MQRTTGDGESEQQTTGRIFIVGIILNGSGLCPGLLDFGIANISLEQCRLFPRGAMSQTLERIRELVTRREVQISDHGSYLRKK